MDKKRIQEFETKLAKIIDTPWSLKYWIEDVKKLKRTNDNLLIVDFDDTIFPRWEQLEKEQVLRENRWILGSKAVIEIMGLQNYLEKYFIGRNYPKTIVNLMDKKRDTIITTWPYEYQLEKIRTCGLLDGYNVIITAKSPEKIVEAIRYVLYKLRYIPKEITVYEDRPEHFIEHKNLIEEVLWVKLNIKKVTMRWYDEEPLIENL